MTRTPFLFLTLAACAAHSPAPAVHNGGGDHSLPREYAALFAPGTVWSFTTDHTVDGGDGAPDKTSGAASCRVVDSARYGDGMESRIACTSLGDDQGYDPVTGVWVATAQGLYFVGVGDLSIGKLPVLTSAEHVLDFAPRAKHSEGKDPDEDEYGWSEDVKRDGDAWCYTRTDDGGDSSWNSICFDEAGVKSGDFGWSGGSTFDTMFTRR